MEKVKKNDVIKVKVTGVQKYGAFVNSEDNNYDGLIHISEISYGYVKNVNDYLKIGDSIYAEVVEVSDKDNQLKLSIKDIDYKKDGTKLKRMAETKNGFTPLPFRANLFGVEMEILSYDCTLNFEEYHSLHINQFNGFMKNIISKNVVLVKI